MVMLQHKASNGKLLRCTSGKLASACGCGPNLSITDEITFWALPGEMSKIPQTLNMTLENLNSQTVDWVGALAGPSIYHAYLGTAPNSGTFVGIDSQVIAVTLTPPALGFPLGNYYGETYGVTGTNPVTLKTKTVSCNINMVVAPPVFETLYAGLNVAWMGATWAYNTLPYIGTSTYGGRACWKWGRTSFYIGGGVTYHCYLWVFSDGLTPLSVCTLYSSRGMGATYASNDNYCDLSGDGQPYGAGTDTTVSGYDRPWTIVFSPEFGEFYEWPP